MKCRKGDLAIVLQGPLVGAIVKVLRCAGTLTMSDGEVLVNAWQTHHSSNNPNWDYFKEDRYLLPIRPGDLKETEERISEKEGD